MVGSNGGTQWRGYIVLTHRHTGGWQTVCAPAAHYSGEPRTQSCKCCPSDAGIMTNFDTHRPSSRKIVWECSTCMYQITVGEVRWNRPLGSPRWNCRWVPWKRVRSPLGPMEARYITTGLIEMHLHTHRSTSKFEKSQKIPG